MNISHQTTKLATLDRNSVYRIICVTVAMALLLGTGILIIKPFIPAIFLAVIFAMATWHPFQMLEAKLEGKTTEAAAIMTALLAIGFIIPLLVLGATLAQNFAGLSDGMINAMQSIPQTPPQWLDNVPFMSERAADRLWSHYVADTAYFTDLMKTNAAPISQYFLGIGSTVGHGVVDLSLGILIAFFFFRHGVSFMDHLKILLDKFFGLRARHLLTVSKNTMIGVIYGMLGTALAQGTVAGIGFWIAGVPGSVFLGLLTFILSPAPIGPPLIWIPAAIWLFAHHQTGMGIFMALWGILGISMIDNVIRPYFISRGSKMPFSLMLLGVFGGIISFGFIGIFIGPTVLAVIYTLLMEWSRLKPESQHEPQALQSDLIIQP